MPKVTPEVLDWNKQWYPVHASKDLDPAKPHSITLLGLFSWPELPCICICAAEVAQMWQTAHGKANVASLLSAVPSLLF